MSISYKMCKGSYLIMTYPIPSYRYKRYTLKPMVVPSTMRHHKYKPSFFILIVNSLFALTEELMSAAS